VAEQRARNRAEAAGPRPRKALQRSKVSEINCTAPAGHARAFDCAPLFLAVSRRSNRASGWPGGAARRMAAAAGPPASSNHKTALGPPPGSATLESGARWRANQPRPPHH